jgi:hypothetical protein
MNEQFFLLWFAAWDRADWQEMRRLSDKAGIPRLATSISEIRSLWFAIEPIIPQ